MKQHLFKIDHLTKVWSRVLLKSNGKDIPYQNELILTTNSKIAGFPKTMEDLKRLNFVKYFHETQPTKVNYFSSVPKHVTDQITRNVSGHMFELLMYHDFNDDLIHIHMPTGFIVQADTCLKNPQDFLKGRYC